MFCLHFDLASLKCQQNLKTIREIMGEAKRRRAVVNQTRLPAKKDFESYASFGKLLFAPGLLKQFKIFIIETSNVSAKYCFKSIYGEEEIDEDLPDLARRALCFPDFFLEATKVIRSKRAITDGLTILDLLKAFCCAYAISVSYRQPQDFFDWLGREEPTVDSNDVINELKKLLNLL